MPPQRSRNKGFASQVSRMGYHFPLDVMRDVINEGANATSKSSRPELSRAMVADVFEQLFPHAPLADKKRVIDHAFKKGTSRVGNAADLTLARRVNLAVGAHIRHNYTAYDQHLKVMQWHDSRHLIEQQVVDIMKQWRGESAVGGATETSFRETIHILESEDEDDLERRPPVKKKIRIDLTGSPETEHDIITPGARAIHRQKNARRAAPMVQPNPHPVPAGATGGIGYVFQGGMGNASASRGLGHVPQATAPRPFVFSGPSTSAFAPTGSSRATAPFVFQGQSSSASASAVLPPGYLRPAPSPYVIHVGGEVKGAAQYPGTHPEVRPVFAWDSSLSGSAPWGALPPPPAAPRHAPHEPNRSWPAPRPDVDRSSMDAFQQNQGSYGRAQPQPGGPIELVELVRLAGDETPTMPHRGQEATPRTVEYITVSRAPNSAYSPRVVQPANHARFGAR